MVLIDPLEAADLQSLTRGGLPWRRIEVVARTGSTNADLLVRARAGEAAGVALITGDQYAGRGRLDRTWSAPPGANVAMSVLVRPDRSPAQWSWLPLLTGLAVADGLQELTGLDLRLKWPNDVLVGERKLSGILAERADAPGGPCCVIGMGINVHLGEADLPVPTATSLALELGAAPARSAVVRAVLTALGRRLVDWEAGDDEGRADRAHRAYWDYRSRCATLGRRVRVQRSGAELLEGLAVAVDAGGRLVVRAGQGDTASDVAVSAGDVIHVR